MPIDKVSSSQYADQLAAGINNRADDVDTAFGPVRDACIQPQAEVLEAQNDRARQLSLMLTLANASAFDGFDADLEGIAFNEGETRNNGSVSATTATFKRASAPASDAVVQRGFPVGSQPDESTGTTVTFVTSEAKTLPALTAASFFNIQTQLYELNVPVVSVIQGSASKVGPNRINRPLRPLGAFDSVTNPTSAGGGRDKETNQELINRYLLGVIGRQLGAPAGINRLALADFPDVQSLKVVFGNNALLLRAATDGGAVDVWVKGESLVQVVENHTYLGLGQLIAVFSPPLVSVISVQSGANTYIEGVDYETVADDSGVGRSIREAAGIRFLPSATTPLPSVGDAVTVTYTYNNLIRALQSGFTTEETLELGRDILFRRGIDAPIVHTAQLKVTTGFNASAVQSAVASAVFNFINGLGLGDDVQASDEQAVVRALSGVDNYIITRNTTTDVLTGTGDIPIDDNEFPTITTANLSVTLI